MTDPLVAEMRQWADDIREMRRPTTHYRVREFNHAAMLAYAVNWAERRARFAYLDARSLRLLDLFARRGLARLAAEYPEGEYAPGQWGWGRGEDGSLRVAPTIRRKTA